MKLPQHLAIIMDGNGRWAQAQGHSRIYGHIKGTRVAKKIITECSKLGIQYLTLYAFSTENWLRPQAEISFLMKILRKYLNKEAANLVRENIRFTVIGEIDRLPADVIASIQKTMRATQECTGLNLVFAISYGSRQEITQAVRKLAQRVHDGDLNPEQIDAALIESALNTYGMPDPDFIIRTSGEKRISNFLLWQAAYAELFFSDTFWPDFTTVDLMTALKEFAMRCRRFGKTNPTSSSSLSSSSQQSRSNSNEQLIH